MSTVEQLDDYGVLTEPATLRIQRLLPGPIERVWGYLTQGELRRRWLASGEMGTQAGTSFKLVWRNDELNDPPSQRPEGFPEEQQMDCVITEYEAPRKLAFTWSGSGEVSFELEPRGKQVLLTLIHRRIRDRSTLLNISGGWHMHLDIMTANLNGTKPAPFWEGWSRLKKEYEARLPA